MTDCMIQAITDIIVGWTLIGILPMILFGGLKLIKYLHDIGILD